MLITFVQIIAGEEWFTKEYIIIYDDVTLILINSDNHYNLHC